MKSLAVSVCITAVTGMAAVSLLVFFWCSSGVLLCSSVFFCVIEHQGGLVFFSFWVLLGSSGVPSGVLLVSFWCSSGVLLVFDNTEEHRRTQKNTEEHRRTPEEHQKNTRSQKNTRRETAAMPVTAVIQTETANDFI
jgi:hypothetical protein